MSSPLRLHEPCLHCGRAPSARLDLREHTGMVVLARYAVLKGTFCKDCGTALFRDRQNATLVKGWWGLLAFFANFYAIGKNVVSWYRIANLDEPAGAAAVTPLDKGRPVFARPGLWVPVALFLALSYLIGADTPPTDPTGACVNLGRNGMTLVDCNELHDGKVLNLVDASTSCAAGSDEAIRLRRQGPTIACVDLDQ